MAFALRRAPVSRKNQAKWGHNITEMECVNLIARGDGDNRRHLTSWKFQLRSRRE